MNITNFSERRGRKCNISVVEKKNQEGSAQPQSAYGAIAAKDSSSAQII